MQNLTSTPPLWVLGAHGGAGEDTLSVLLPGSMPAGHLWPVPPPGLPGATVLVVCRSNQSGLRAAQRAAVEYAAGTVFGVRLLGLVIVADAPGKRPKQLRALAKVVAGGFPEVWEFPWIEGYRVSATQPVLPRSAAVTIQTISDRLALIKR
jgi:CTP:molybdopterin cytidylyltransferase MocA